MSIPHRDMERVLETHQFGSHRVVVIEHLEDDGIAYSVLIDNRSVTDEPMSTPPSFADVVRLYANALQAQAGTLTSKRTAQKAQ